MVALGVLLWLAVRAGDAAHLVGFTVFGLSQVALFTASALYHSLRLTPANIARLRRIDHMMVFVLIAGTYTPICLIALHGVWRWGLLGLVWALTLGGLLFTTRWMHAPGWLSTGYYVLIGWIGIGAAPVLFHALPPAGVAWMLVGGVVYTVGALIFILERPRLRPGVFDSHALWHLCVLGGSFCCFWLVVRYVAPLG